MLSLAKACRENVGRAAPPATATCPGVLSGVARCSSEAGLRPCFGPGGADCALATRRKPVDSGWPQPPFSFFVLSPIGAIETSMLSPCEPQVNQLCDVSPEFPGSGQSHRLALSAGHHRAMPTCVTLVYIPIRNLRPNEFGTAGQDRPWHTRSGAAPC